MARVPGEFGLQKKIAEARQRQRKKDAKITYTIYGAAYEGLLALRANNSALTDGELIQKALRLYGLIEKKTVEGCKLQLVKPDGRVVKFPWKSVEGAR